MLRTADSWIKQYQQKDALWFHDGNPKRPHPLLTSGMHSNGFFNSRLIISDEVLLHLAASDLTEMCPIWEIDLDEIKGVVGPQTGATKLAEFVSYQVMAYTGKPCFWMSPAKNEVDGVKSMIFNHEELDLLPGQTVLLCEDVITTGDSVDLAADAVLRAGGFVLPAIVALVNRSGLEMVSGKTIIALINHPMPIWTPEDCKEHHLCSLGSEAIRPKGPPEWARLNATY